jgi:hypothetical protein
MAKILNEELNYMKYLLGYKKGIVISEQEVQQQTTNTPQQTQTTNNNSDDGCKKIVASGKFSATKADSTEHMDNIIAKLDSQIKADPLFANGGLVTNLRLIGGASNYNGGKVTNYTLNNDYTPVASQPTLTDNDKNNMKYALARANAARQPVIDELEKLNLTIQGEPKIESHIINTNGKTDEKNTSGNPGQIVMIEAMICPLKQAQSSASRKEIDKLVPLKPKLIPTTGEITNTIENLTECYENSEIKIYYGAPRRGHYCNKALYNVYANGILLKRADGKDYASLNNVGDKFDDAEIIKGERYKSCGRLNRCGRSNTFTLDRITNEAFFNKDVLYKHNGGLVITASCVDKGQGSYGGDSDCHTDVGDISFKIKGANEEAMEASETPNMFNDIKQIAKFDACKTFKLQAAK